MRRRRIIDILVDNTGLAPFAEEDKDLVQVVLSTRASYLRRRASSQNSRVAALCVLVSFLRDSHMCIEGHTHIMKRSLCGKREKGATKWFYDTYCQQAFHDAQIRKVMFTNEQGPNAHICEERFFFDGTVVNTPTVFASLLR